MQAHDGCSFWTDRLPAPLFTREFLRVGSGNYPVLKGSSGACEPLESRGHAKDIATQMAGILALAFSEDLQLLAADNKGAPVHLALFVNESALTLEPRAKTACMRSRGLTPNLINPPTTDVKKPRSVVAGSMCAVQGIHLAGYTCDLMRG